MGRHANQPVADGAERSTKKLMIAAGLAARGKGPLPPQLWRWHIAGNPTWSEFDSADYCALVHAIILKNVYDTVKAFTSGRPSPEQLKEYSRLVGMGVVGKDVK
jgi:hypothetical protein